MFARGLQVVVMGGDEHHVARLAGEQRHGAPVRLRVGLVMPEDLGRENRIEAQIGVPRQIDEQRHVAVRERREDVPLAQAHEPRARVRPGLERVPTPHDPGAIVRRERALDREARGELLERCGVQLVEIAPRERARSNARHRRPIGRAPRVDERGPIARDAALGAERGQVANDTRAPVHERPEHVEEERANARRVHGRTPDRLTP